MNLKKLAARLADYKDRLDKGQAREITPEDVQIVLAKLRRMESDLVRLIGAPNDAAEQARLRRKLGVVRDQIARAEWVLGALG